MSYPLKGRDLASLTVYAALKQILPSPGSDRANTEHERAHDRTSPPRFLRLDDPALTTPDDSLSHGSRENDGAASNVRSFVFGLSSGRTLDSPGPFGRSRVHEGGRPGRA